MQVTGVARSELQLQVQLTAQCAAEMQTLCRIAHPTQFQTGLGMSGLGLDTMDTHRSPDAPQEEAVRLKTPAGRAPESHLQQSMQGSVEHMGWPVSCIPGPAVVEATDLKTRIGLVASPPAGRQVLASGAVAAKKTCKGIRGHGSGRSQEDSFRV